MKCLLILFYVCLTICLFTENSFAEDSYNFYFVKEKEQKKELKVEPAQVKPSSAQENRVKTKNEESPKEPEYRKWVASLAIGSSSSSVGVSYLDEGATSGMGYEKRYNTQSIYSLGVRYNWSRYFDFHGNILVPAGAPLGESAYNRFQDDGFDLQVLAGLGVTPFHFYFLDFPFLEIGVDSTFAFGEAKYLGGNSVALLLGPRVSFNFSRGFSINIIVQSTLLNTENSYTVGTLGGSYRW